MFRPYAEEGSPAYRKGSRFGGYHPWNPRRRSPLTTKPGCGAWPSPPLLILFFLFSLILHSPSFAWADVPAGQGLAFPLEQGQALRCMNFERAVKDGGKTGSAPDPLQRPPLGDFRTA